MLRVLMQVGKMRSNNALVASADREIRCDLKFSGGRASYVVFIDGDDTFACTNEEGHILIWKVCRHEPIRTIPAHKESVTKLVVLPGGSHLASCSIDGFVRLWNWKNGKLVAESKIRGGRIHDMAVTSEGKAYLASEDLVLRAVDLRTGASVGELSIPERDDHYVSEDKPWLLWRTRVAVTPTGVVVFTTIDNQVGFLRPPGQLVMSKTHRATIRDLALDRDGRFAVTAGSDGMVCVWGTTKTELVASFRTENDVRACGITPHGAKVICGEISGNVHVLQLENVESDLS